MEEMVWDISEREMGYEYDEIDWSHPGNPAYYGYN